MKTVFKLIIALIAFSSWLVSALFNTWFGYTVGASANELMGYMVATLALCFELVVPSYLIYKSIVGSDSAGFAVFSYLFIAMSISVSVVSLDNSIQMSVSKNIGMTDFAEASIESEKYKLEANILKSSSLEITPAQTNRVIFKRIDKLKNSRAYNLAGVYTNKTVWQVTNRCTRGIYYTSNKLYSDQCALIKRLEREARENIKRNKVVVSNKKKMAEMKMEASEIKKSIAENDRKKHEKLPFLSKIKDNISSYTLGFALSVEMLKQFFMVLAVSSWFSVGNRKPKSKSSFISKTIERRYRVNLARSKAKGKREAELEFESNKVKSKAEDIARFISADEFMPKLKTTDLEMVIDFDKAIKGKSVKKDDVMVFTVLVCRLYSENGSVKLQKTLLATKALAKSISSSSSDELFTLHRLRTIILPTLVNTGFITKSANSGSNSYCWNSSKEVEKIFIKEVS